MTLTILFAIYCLEAGLFFLFAPWTRFWAMHPILHWTSAVGAVADNPFFRGFVSGFGVVHFILGIREVRAYLKARRASR